MEVGAATSFLANFWSYSALPLTLKNYRIPKIGSLSTDNIREKPRDSPKKRDERPSAPQSTRTDINRNERKIGKKSTKRRIEKTIDSDDDAPLSRRKKRGGPSFKPNRIEDDEDIPYRFVTAADSEEENVIRTVESTQEPDIDHALPMVICEETFTQQDQEASPVNMPEAQSCTSAEVNALPSNIFLSEQTQRTESVTANHETTAVAVPTVNNDSLAQDAPPETHVPIIPPYTDVATTEADADIHRAPTRPQSPEAVSSLSDVEMTTSAPSTTETSVQLPDSVTTFQRMALQQMMLKLKCITDAQSRNERDRKAAVEELTKLETERQNSKDRVVTLSGIVLKDKHIADQIREAESMKEHLGQMYVLQEAKLEELPKSEFDFETYEAMTTAALNELDKIGHALNSINNRLEGLRTEHQSIVSAGDALEGTRSNLMSLEKNIAELKDELNRLEAEKITLDANRKDAEDEWRLEREKRRKILKLVPSKSASPLPFTPMLSTSSLSPTSEFHSQVVMGVLPRSSDARSAEVTSPDSATSPSCMSTSQTTSSIKIKSEMSLNPTPEDASKKLSSLFSKARSNPVVKAEKPRVKLPTEVMEAFEELVYNALLIKPVSSEAFISTRKSFLSMIEMEEKLILPVLYVQLQKKEGNKISMIPYCVFEREYEKRIAVQCNDETLAEVNTIACATTTVPQPSTSAEPLQETSQWISTDTSSQMPLNQTGVSVSSSVSFSQHQASWTAPAQSMVEYPDRRQSLVQYFQQSSNLSGGNTQGNAHSTPLPNYSPSSTTHNYRQGEVESQYQPYAVQPQRPSDNQQCCIQQQMSTNRGMSVMYSPVSYATQQNNCSPSYMTNAQQYQHWQQQLQQSRLCAEYASPQCRTGTTSNIPSGGSPVNFSIGHNWSQIDQAAPMGSKCLVCSVPSAQVCSRCNSAAYCSKECQVRDWRRHRMTCGQQVMKKSPNSE